MHSVWHGKGLVDMTAAVPLNSTDTHHSAMKLCSNCTVFSNTRMMSEKVMDEGRENQSSVTFLGSLFTGFILLLSALLKMPT